MMSQVHFSMKLEIATTEIFQAFDTIKHSLPEHSLSPDIPDIYGTTSPPPTTFSRSPFPLVTIHFLFLTHLSA